MDMKVAKSYSLKEIQQKLEQNELPFSGITVLGSTEFHFLKPTFFAGVAMHAGKRIRPEVLEKMMVSKADRFREEDPFTDRFIKDFPMQIIGRESRFEYDLNREPFRAIYDTKEKSWGLKIWRQKLTQQERTIPIMKHNEFHDLMDIVTAYLLQQNRYAVIFDMHSYCYQREEILAWFEDPKPEINVGTKAVNRNLFGSGIEKLIEQLSLTRINGYPIRVMENALFEGGYMARRLSQANYDRLLVLALEYKKIFMDELSGKLFDDKLEKLILDFSAMVKNLTTSSFFMKCNPSQV